MEGVATTMHARLVLGLVVLLAAIVGFIVGIYAGIAMFTSETCVDTGPALMSCVSEFPRRALVPAGIGAVAFGVTAWQIGSAVVRKKMRGSQTREE